ncbi:MAG: glycosyltransferase family 4 protein [Candidatus Dormiibacterota bacterium]
MQPPDQRRFAFVLEQTLGHAAHTRNIERLLQADGVGADLIKLSYRKRAELPRWERLPGFRTWSFQASRGARDGLQHRLRQGRLDAIFIHTQVAALLAPSIMRTVPTVVSLDATPHNVDALAAAYDHRRNADVLEHVKVRINQRVFRRAAALVTWCHWAARSLERDYDVPPESIRVIPPGVELGLFRKVAVRRPGPPRILFVGGQLERKGGTDLLLAMQRLGSAAELDIVTGGEVTVPDGVVCRVHRGLEPQSPPLLDLYQQADIFALPSRGDCMPQAIAEAMASGLPVVASTVGAIPEMVTDDVTGYLVPPSNPYRLALALAKLVREPSLRAGMGRAGQLQADEEHDAMRNNRAIVELLGEVAAGPPAVLGRSA